MRTCFWLVLLGSLSCHLRTMAFFRMDVGLQRDGMLRPLKRFKRGWMWNQFFLQEEYTGAEQLYIGKLQLEQDKGDGTVKYVLSGEGAGSIFTIEESTGNLHAIKRLDREEKAFYILRAQALSKITGRPLEPETEFIVKIHDINDNEPVFTKELYTASVPEMSPIGTSVIQVNATDADDISYGNSAKVVYSILQGQPYFSVDAESGIIRTAIEMIDREKREHYQVEIQAKDMAGQRGGLFGTTKVNITLLDVNDNPPQFPQSMYQYRIAESKAVGSVVGKVKATDADLGRNAEMVYKIVGGDGLGAFDVVRDPSTQEGIIIVKKPLDYEKKKSYIVQLQVENIYLDIRYLPVGTRDIAEVKVIVEDVNEPPTFSQAHYMLEVKEDALVSTAVGSVTAVDPDSVSIPVRYSIDRRTDLDHIFNVHPANGSIFTQKLLDRETVAWHNISMIATEFDNPRLSSHVPVYIRVQDVNDNAPTFGSIFEAFVCENAKAGQTIQTMSATDADDPPNGHRFFFNIAPEDSTHSNFSVRDNGDNTAGLVTRRSGFSGLQRRSYTVPVVVSDGEYPRHSSTGTVTVHVCACDREGNMEMCHAEALSRSAGLSMAALGAILLCLILLLLILALFAAVRRHRKKEPLIMSKEDIRDNIVSYNDEGGGEEDTHAFDIGTLRNPAAIEESTARRDIIPETLYTPVCRPGKENPNVQNFINQKVEENDGDPAAPPYDSLATYAYEGSGSVAESLSTLGSAASDSTQDYNYLSQWGPRFRRLADLYGGDEGLC